MTELRRKQTQYTSSEFFLSSRSSFSFGKRSGVQTSAHHLLAGLFRVHRYGQGGFLSERYGGACKVGTRH
ncbi:hypothetical protein Pmani_019518 [Petrolisthes manimaculis]|uniref:Uncharacterized protein n=1 Tax=Petrolisthes manimaculis TaxID=1843537 RepID=A0AAE1PIQ4_9EUCA|nr:hypothetical protein Pmani_019518 [Petrolisthes manimaculis]